MKLSAALAFFYLDNPFCNLRIGSKEFEINFELEKLIHQSENAVVLLHTLTYLAQLSIDGTVNGPIQTIE